MRSILCFCTLVCLLGVLNAKKEYTNKFDNIDIDSILSNGRILQNYTKCLLDKGPCTAEGRELKKLLPDALSSECSKCTAVQKRNSTKVINFLRTNKPADWKQLMQKYDPKGAHKARFESNGTLG